MKKKIKRHCKNCKKIIPNNAHARRKFCKDSCRVNHFFKKNNINNPLRANWSDFKGHLTEKKTKEIIRPIFSDKEDNSYKDAVEITKGIYDTTTLYLNNKKIEEIYKNQFFINKNQLALNQKLDRILNILNSKITLI